MYKNCKYKCKKKHYIRGLELMKLIFAVLDVSITMGLTRCYKTEGFLHLYYKGLALYNFSIKRITL